MGGEAHQIPDQVPSWATLLVERLAQDPTLPEEYLIKLRSQLTTLPTAAPKQAKDLSRPATIRTQAELEKVGAALKSEPVVSIDLETAGLDPRRGEIVGFGIACGQGTYYIPTGHRFPESHQLLPDQLVAQDVARVLGLEHLPLVAHNAKFELKWLRRQAGINPTFVWDTMLVARLLRCDLPADLKETARRVLDVPEWGLDKKELEQIQHLPVDRVARYCGKDAFYTLELMRRQQSCLA